MLTLQVCAIRDRALDTFMQPFFVPSVGLAIRSFGDAINDKQHEMNKHPDDYDLWHLGTFNTVDGTFNKLDGDRAIVQIAIGKNMTRA